MTNKEAVMAFLRQTKPAGQNGKRTLFWEGRILYSYGHHYPLAALYGGTIVLLNADSYSITTTQHKRLVLHFAAPRRAIEVPRVNPSDDKDHNANLAHLASELAKARRSLKRAKAPHMIDWHEETIERLMVQEGYYRTQFDL